MKNSLNIDKWLKLIRAEGVGPRTFDKLIDRFGSIDDALSASVGQLTKVDGVGEKKARQITSTRDKFDVDAELELAQKLGVWIIHRHDERYPALLKQIDDPPVALYIKGTLLKEDNLAVAIVGSRRCSTYGSEQASRFGHLLASAGFTIVSGMARGIDTSAHHGALSAGGRTIAVQGTGLAKIFPPENEKLAELISKSGALVSELPLNYEPLSENFPPRNRIIAGLTLGTIVIEASHRSGALITANFALDYNREVMAIPGKIDSPFSKGTNMLIKQGARLVESPQDVLDALGYIGQQLNDYAVEKTDQAQRNIESKTKTNIKIKLSSDESRILKNLDHEPVHIDELITTTGSSASKVSCVLVGLQLKGLVKQLPGNFFRKNC